MLNTATRPAPGEYAPDFERYIRLVPEGDVLEILAEQLGRVESLLRPLSEAQSLAVHPPYTWTLKQVVGHLTDCEGSLATGRCALPDRILLRCPALMRTSSCSSPTSTLVRCRSCSRSSPSFAADICCSCGTFRRKAGTGGAPRSVTRRLRGRSRTRWPAMPSTIWRSSSNGSAAERSTSTHVGGSADWGQRSADPSHPACSTRRCTAVIFRRAVRRLRSVCLPVARGWLRHLC
jgi:hypothetical protein